MKIRIHFRYNPIKNKFQILSVGKYEAGNLLCIRGTFNPILKNDIIFDNSRKEIEWYLIAKTDIGFRKIEYNDLVNKSIGIKQCRSLISNNDDLCELLNYNY